MAQPSTVAGFPLACHGERLDRGSGLSSLASAPYSRDCGTKAGHFRTARCCNGTNVARSTADVGEAVLSTSSSAAAFSSVHRDNG